MQTRGVRAWEAIAAALASGALCEAAESIRSMDLLLVILRRKEDSQLAAVLKANYATLADIFRAGEAELLQQTKLSQQDVWTLRSAAGALVGRCLAGHLVTLMARAMGLPCLPTKAFQRQKTLGHDLFGLPYKSLCCLHVV